MRNKKFSCALFGDDGDALYISKMQFHTYIEVEERLSTGWENAAVYLDLNSLKELINTLQAEVKRLEKIK